MVEFHAVGHVFGGDEFLAPCKHDHRIDEECQKEVDQHAANHDKETLPGRFGAKLPRLRRLFHLFLVHAFIYHACYLAVAAQREPSYAVGGVALLGLEAEQAAVPLAHTGVEEEIEFIHADAEQLCEEEVAALVQEHQQRDGHDEL